MGNRASIDGALQWVRRRQRPLARAVLALFCLAWLQAAALPCVMAHTTGMDAGPAAEHCVYCPPHGCGQPATPDPGACSYPHEPQVDARAAAVFFIAVPTVETLIAPAPADPALSMRAVSLREPPPRVPIPESYCRHIE